MLGQKQFAEPNWHGLTFLHLILMCRVTNWARLGMLLQYLIYKIQELVGLTSKSEEELYHLFDPKTVCRNQNLWIQASVRLYLTGHTTILVHCLYQGFQEREVHACKEGAPPEFARVATIDCSIDNGKFWGNTEIIISGIMHEAWKYASSSRKWFLCK
jgi:hypothetical protein